MGKILVIVSIVLSLAAAGLGFFNRSQFVLTKSNLAQTESDLAASKKDAQDKQASLEETKKSLADTESQLQVSKSEVDKLKSEVAQKSSQITDLTTKLSAKDAELAAAKAEAQQKSEEVARLNEQIAAASQVAATDESKTRITELETLNSKLQSDLESAQTKANNLEKAARERETKQALTRITGRILAVNQAWNFVVLSLGDKQGVESNMELVVRRGTTLVGKVRVTTVEPASSIADILPTALGRGMSIQPGDEVTYQAPGA